ncbi:putative uncharacterized protein [Mycolicibacterium thermoresistibile]|uniref:Uncharacterized protein n=1 Tax=Mycolicibacterium thermoresistibile TaxID=1797 RepID=A0A117ILC9_MYCTH|nr:putative uncharacterized protein [Mycolicibacterium thermoresistibile]
MVSPMVPGSTVDCPALVDGDGVWDLAVTATVAPSAANRWAMARPIPRLLPVTNAVLPWSKSFIAE